MVKNNFKSTAVYGTKFGSSYPYEQVNRHTEGLILRIKLVIPAKEEHSLDSKKAFYFCSPVSDSGSEFDFIGWLVGCFFLSV